MYIGFTREQLQLRDELRDYFGNLMTPERTAELNDSRSEYGSGTTYRDTVRQIGKDGWLGVGWPKEYGGQDRTMIEQMIFSDEASRAGAPLPLLTIGTVGPTIMEYGSQEQKDFFLPKILGGELHFAIGYSEPDAGTDLASLSTNPDAPKHKGISVLAVPTGLPGFSWSPVRTLSGATTSQTFYEDMRVPTSTLVGQENNGWRLVTGQLNRERVALCSPVGVQNALAVTEAWAKETKLRDGRRVIDQEWVRANIGRVHAKVEFLKLINWKIAWGVSKGVSPADASATKVFGTEFATEAYRLLMECFGEDAYIKGDSPSAVAKGRVERAMRGA